MKIPVPRKKKLPTVQFKKLGRHQCWGHWVKPGQIMIDPRLTSREFLDTLLHECLHEFMPYIEEDTVNDVAHNVMRVLWREGVRRIVK